MNKKQQKIIQLYKNKYDMNLGSLTMFLNERIQASSYQIDIIQKKIKDLQIQSNFNEEALKTILRLIAAVQIGKNVAEMTQKQIRKIQDYISFKSSKNKSKKQKKSNFYQQNSQIIQVEPQSQINAQKYPSITYQIKEAQNKLKQYADQAKQSNSKIKQKLNQYQQIQIQVEQEESIQIKVKKQQSKNDSKPTVKRDQSKQILIPKKVSEKQKQVIIEKNQKKELTKQKNDIVLKQQIKGKQKPIEAKKQQKQQKNQESIHSKQNLSSPKKVSQSKLRTIIQENSTQINITSEQREIDQPVFLQMENGSSKKKVKIVSYDKYSTDYVNSVIKYKIQYKGGTVQRRYSDFQKLMANLNSKYQGIILPELPPKEGIKSGFSYFWGIDQNFLNQRQVKLQQVLNRLLQSKFIQKDDLLQDFLTQETFQVNSNQQGFGSYLKTVSDIVFNANQLKVYGIAYFNYMTQADNVKLNTDLQKMYESMKQTINIFVDLNQYRTIINANFEKRRKIMFDQSIKSRSATNCEFDKIMQLAIEQIKNLHHQYNKYRQLKNLQSWKSSLLKQKSDQVTTKAYIDLKNQQTSLKERIQKMQKNLMKSLQDFNQTKKAQLQRLSEKLIDWRKKVHP